MKIPLENRLRKRLHIDIARLQDEVVEILYNIDNSLVLHGGTAVWRCYHGNRFSEDLDFYSPNIKKITNNLESEIKKHGLELKKFKKTENLIFCKIGYENVEIRIEINFAKKVNYILGKYENLDGTEMNVFVLSPEDLLLEKLSAYENRRFIRDIYDVFHLSSLIKDEKRISNLIREFLKEVKPPVDEKNLKALIYSGPIPSFNQIIEALKLKFL